MKNMKGLKMQVEKVATNNEQVADKGKMWQLVVMAEKNWTPSVKATEQWYSISKGQGDSRKTIETEELQERVCQPLGMGGEQGEVTKSYYQ